MFGLVGAASPAEAVVVGDVTLAVWSELEPQPVANMTPIAKEAANPNSRLGAFFIGADHI